MSSGPTPEEFRNYWNNNRQYFETLAKYYAETDKEYYRNYIAPFYGPFRSGSGKPKLLIFLSAFILVMGIAVAAVLFLVTQKDSEKEVSPPKTIQKDTTLNRLLKDTTINRLLKDSTLQRFLSPENDRQIPKGRNR